MMFLSEPDDNSVPIHNGEGDGTYATYEEAFEGLESESYHVPDLFIGRVGARFGLFRQL